MYLFFDTETTGKPKKYDGKMSDLDNWPRITQLAWQVADQEGNVIAEREFLIKPDGWEVPKEQFFIDNNMSTERCEEFGVELPKLLDVFLNDYESCRYLIAHNIKFDHNVLGAEMIRYERRSETKLTKVCTMLASVNYCRFPGRYGSYKWPQLIELYQKLFNKKFDGAHDAMIDVTACRESFFKLMELGVINLSTKQNEKV